MDTPHDLPVACSLTPEAIRARRSALLPGLFRRADVVERIQHGIRLRFSPSSDTLDAITRTIDAERQCCRFLRFELTIEPGGGPLWLSLTGPAGTAEFLEALVSG